KGEGGHTDSSQVRTHPQRRQRGSLRSSSHVPQRYRSAGSQDWKITRYTLCPHWRGCQDFAAHCKLVGGFRSLVCKGRRFQETQNNISTGLGCHCGRRVRRVLQAGAAGEVGGSHRARSTARAD
ncbi:hypothetical protein DXG01_000663, partial [Tephrocybe rancida]